MDVLELLKRHEGYRQIPYYDTVGKLTGGHGRNLTDKGISREEAGHMLENDIAEARTALNEHGWFLALNDARQAVLIDMTVNMGIKGLLRFEKMLAALEAYDYATAAREALNSRWAIQVGQRAVELHHMLISGQWPTE